VNTERLNTICPYYTMYPLQFPLRVLRAAQPKGWVLDPFCGRGTTNFAARLLGLNTVGFDSSPIAAAVASAKLACASATEVITEAQRILLSKCDVAIPEGDFWDRAFHRSALVDICRLRKAIGIRPRTSAQVMLRALVLGVLHGPLTKGPPSYLSNQCPRTFAPKPAYAVRFWRRNRFLPRQVDTLLLIQRRAQYCLLSQPRVVEGYILRADSRNPAIFQSRPKFSWVITSPPYYGMCTYIPDQWLRNWFVGGPPLVSYTQPQTELSHSSPESFSKQLRQVWQNLEKACVRDARLICRFGGINDRDVEPLDLLKLSLSDTSWRLITIRNAGTAHNGKRQASQFGIRGQSVPKREYDVYARLAN
jgi:DNA methylase